MKLIGYIKENQKTFLESDINDIDVLAFAWMSYFDFSPLKEKLPLKIGRLKSDKFYLKNKAYETGFLIKTSKRFMKLVMNSNRFNDVELLDYQCVLDKSLSAQFCAVSFKVDDKIVVSFRGTDPNFIGWKEDFYLAFKESISSYQLAKDYVLNIISKYQENIILTGHSKGGNIASYVLADLEDDSRIIKSISFDGPGFRDTTIFDEKLDRVVKIKKYIPHSSLVGVLFSNETEVKIIKSGSALVLQHNPFEWEIKNNDFVYLDKRTITSRYLDKSINGWIESLNEEEKERFTKIVFDYVDEFEAQDIRSFFKRLFKQVTPAFKAYKKLSKEDKKFFIYVMMKLAKNLARPPKDENKVKSLK